jgi:hypothetical protein
MWRAQWDQNGQQYVIDQDNLDERCREEAVLEADRCVRALVGAFLMVAVMFVGIAVAVTVALW